MTEHNIHGTPSHTSTIADMTRRLHEAGFITSAHTKRLHYTHPCGVKVILPRSCPANTIARRGVVSKVMNAIAVARRSRS